MRKAAGRRWNVALAMVLVGCAHFTSTPVAPPAGGGSTQISAEDRARLGLIGVVSAEYVPTLEIVTPERFSTAGAAAGLAKGFAMGLLGAAGCFLTVGRFGEACVLALGTPVWMVREAEMGAKKVDPPPEVVQNLPSLQSGLLGMPVQQELRDRIVEAARAQDRHFFFRLTEAGPHSPYDAIDHERWAGEGIDTILEVRLESVVLRQEVDPSSLVHGIPWSGGGDPAFPLLVKARTRLIRAADGVELAARAFEHRRTGYPIALWAADEVKRFREALAVVSQALAQEMLDDLFPP